MRTIALGVVFIILVAGSSMFLAQVPAGSPGAGNPLGPLVTGTDFSGSWRWLNHQDSPLFTATGDIADWGGIPLNDAARLYALSWPASRLTVKQQQCMGYVAPYTWMSPGNHRIWEERDPFTQRLIAIHYWGQIAQVDRTIYVDGRPQPPAYAPHTFAGFSTGKFEGNVLTITTTHLKRGWLRANGAPQSDAATVIEHLIRHGDTVTVFSVIDDPVYLSTPLSKTSLIARQAVAPDAWLYACDDSEQILGRKSDYVPSHLFGQNPYFQEYAEKNKVPLLAAFGGRDTIYPELLAAVKDNTAADTAAKAKMFPAGPPLASRAPDPTPADGNIHVWHVAGNVYMLAGDGANIAVQVGPQGALVVDTGAGKLSDKVLAEISKLSTKPIQFIVNTSFHGDHIGGNKKLQAAGADPSLTGSFFSAQFADAGQGATIIGQQNVQTRMQEQKPPIDAPPSDTYIEDRRRKYHNEEAVEIFPMANAITDGDSIVHFRRSDVIVAGDIFSTVQYPFIDVKNGGSLQGEIQALNFILDKTVYQHDEDGGTLVIPGHGRITNEFEVAEYRDMLVIFRDRTQAMIKTGATLEQVKAARLTADYDVRFGATSGPWTTDMFVEAMYTSLKNPPKTSGAK
jgi:glyoxylase-like metal-dependent hydrolase (beta-lactamase superfamily II)